MWISSIGVRSTATLTYRSTYNNRQTSERQRPICSSYLFINLFFYKHAIYQHYYTTDCDWSAFGTPTYLFSNSTECVCACVWSACTSVLLAQLEPQEPLACSATYRLISEAPATTQHPQASAGIRNIPLVKFWQEPAGGLLLSSGWAVDGQEHRVWEREGGMEEARKKKKRWAGLPCNHSCLPAWSIVEE